MSTRLRAFTKDGIERFSQYLDEVRAGLIEGVPVELLLDETFSTPLGEVVYVASKILGSKLEAAEYLHSVVKDLRGSGFYDVGIWTWLSAFYFESVCPVEDGLRRPGKNYRHILQPGRDWWHFYRHLLAGPVRTFDFHRERGKLLLYGPVNIQGDWVEQLCSRQEIASNRGVIEAATILYWDEQSKRPKKRAAPSEHRPGTLRRFVDVIQQLELTYDLNSMTGEEVLELLPPEFNAWR